MIRRLVNVLGLNGAAAVDLPAVQSGGPKVTGTKRAAIPSQPPVAPFVPRRPSVAKPQPIFSHADPRQFDLRPLVFSDLKLRNGRRVRAIVANHFDLDLICRFLETQFDSERHFEQGFGASVDDVETHLYAKAKRGVFCPFSLIVFEGERMVGLLMGSSWEHRAPPRHTPFALKQEYGDEVDGGPYLQREGNRVKAFEEILLDEFSYFVEPGAPRIGLVEMLVTAPEYNNGELERVLLSHALKRAADAETRFLGFLCATDADRAACGECGFTRFMDVKYADFFDRDFRGPAHLLDPKQSDRMSLYIAKTTR